MYNEIKDLLQALVKEEGIFIFKDKDRINILVGDYFPDKRKERRAILDALDLGIGLEFIEISKITDKKKKHNEISKLKSLLVNKTRLSEGASNFVLNSFAYAIEKNPSELKKREKNQYSNSEQYKKELFGKKENLGMEKQIKQRKKIRKLSIIIVGAVAATIGIAVCAFVILQGGSEGTDIEESTVWDGTVDTSWYNSSDTEFTLTTPEELAGLATIVNNQNIQEDFGISGAITNTHDPSIPSDSFEGKTIKLGNDIDLGGKEWTPIGYIKQIEEPKMPGEYGVAESHSYLGNFDGQGYTISNLSIKDSEFDMVGLFGAVQSEFPFTPQGMGLLGRTADEYMEQMRMNDYTTNTTIKNLTLENIDISTDANNIGGILGESLEGGVIIENCNVSGEIDGTLTEYGSCGGVFGSATVIKIMDTHIEVNLFRNSYTENNPNKPKTSFAGGYDLLRIIDSSETGTINDENVGVKYEYEDLGGISFDGGEPTW